LARANNKQKIKPFAHLSRLFGGNITNRSLPFLKKQAVMKRCKKETNIFFHTAPASSAIFSAANPPLLLLEQIFCKILKIKLQNSLQYSPKILPFKRQNFLRHTFFGYFL
jgi:hypothetical protein